MPWLRYRLKLEISNALIKYDFLRLSRRSAESAHLFELFKALQSVDDASQADLISIELTPDIEQFLSSALFAGLAAKSSPPGVLYDETAAIATEKDAQAASEVAMA